MDPGAEERKRDALIGDGEPAGSGGSIAIVLKMRGGRPLQCGRTHRALSGFAALLDGERKYWSTVR
jgi:hypothetical protein